ncbi:unnamed protein product [Cyprideis torosa]|uniref:Uncharacterized protein n=1 Tax=Cyprideis torosa TaxID=163714 RepID=A0A7R8WJJ6_9CRUS|nr:unnamed protein product [Cyprideis torosa]CAG0895797.1 unnamed protein product [Cyprideis torosa]
MVKRFARLMLYANVVEMSLYHFPYVSTIALDQSETDAPTTLVDFAISEFGKIDVVVSSAGILTSGGIETLSVEDYDKQMNINARAVFLLVKAAIPHLLKTKGNIVVVSSVTGLRAFPGVVAYNMSKAAVDHLVRSAALEVASRGVRVNAVNPGVIVTEVHKRAGMKDEDYQKFLEHSKTTHAMGRVGTVREVAQSILFLASEETASFITGQTLAIDGGRSSGSDSAGLVDPCRKHAICRLGSIHTAGFDHPLMTLSSKRSGSILTVRFKRAMTLLDDSLRFTCSRRAKTVRFKTVMTLLDSLRFTRSESAKAWKC